jgi:hypothetical protein
MEDDKKPPTNGERLFFFAMSILLHTVVFVTLYAAITGVPPAPAFAIPLICVGGFNGWVFGPSFARWMDM